MMTKQAIGIVCGGQSGEHEVSLRSAYEIFRAVDRMRFTPCFLGVDKSGRWRLGEDVGFLEHPEDPRKISISKGARGVVPGVGVGPGVLLDADTRTEIKRLDAALPIIHGTSGEDGTLQGLLELLDLPYVGADVGGSAVGMDKGIMKRLLAFADLPVTPFETLYSPAEGDFAALKARLGLPLFVKPNALGSSVGVSRVEDEAGFAAALELAFAYDEKVLVEQFVAGREIECAVLGSRYSQAHPPQASRVGEIVPRNDFYSYDAKYLDAEGADLRVPAHLSPEEETRVRELALRVCEVLQCEGMARVDFFMPEGGGLMVNEINTLPGFTPISMYPRLWQESGLSYPELINTLIALALERHQRRKGLRREFPLA